MALFIVLGEDFALLMRERADFSRHVKKDDDQLQTTLA
jgi:hypothetical protein